MNYNYWLSEAYKIAKNSPDTSTQIGAILVDDVWSKHDVRKFSNTDDPAAGYLILGTGINSFPDGIKATEARSVRPAKYKWTEHAERNAIYAAARHGKATDNSILVCTWACCTDCARAIVQAGVKTLVTHKQAADRPSDHWKQEIEISMEILTEANIKVIIYDGLIGAAPLLKAGEIWNP